MSEIEVGVVRHFFDRLDVAAVELTSGDLAVGDTLHIRGHTSDVTTRVDSIQLEQEKLTRAAKGQNVGIKITGKVREHDRVFKVVP